MSFSLMVYVRIFCSLLTILTCLCGDYLDTRTDHPLLRALCDNATHALIGALTGISFVIHFHDKISNITGWLMMFGCFACSSLIDLDHFIKAKSFSLEMATSIVERPFLHCSTIPVVLIMIYILSALLNCFKMVLILGIICCAFITHHSRDAYRRGFWFCPFGHTKTISYTYYIVIIVATPYVVVYLYHFCRTSLIQGLLGGLTKHFDISNKPAPRYSVV